MVSNLDRITLKVDPIIGGGSGRPKLFFKDHYSDNYIQAEDLVARTAALQVQEKFRYALPFTEVDEVAIGGISPLEAAHIAQPRRSQTGESTTTTGHTDGPYGRPR